MSIGKALYSLLATHPDLLPLLSGRVYAVKFAQAKAFPAITYNTENVKALPCRNPGMDKKGVIELALLTDTYGQMEELSEALIATLEHKTHLKEGFRLSFSEADPDFTEEAEDLNALYKRIQFILTATPV